jgi:hypothetical protein
VTRVSSRVDGMETAGIEPQRAGRRTVTRVSSRVDGMETAGIEPASAVAMRRLLQA